MAHKAPKIKVFASGALGSTIEVPVEENKFPVIYVDLTHRCNYDCNFCYNPIRTLPDMSLDYFTEVCKRLPSRVIFRFMGGEPTMHPDFLEFMTTAHQHKHMVSFVSNGTKFADKSFAQAVKDTGVPVIATLSMNGGTNNEWYKFIDNKEAAEEKLQALANMDEVGLNRIAITAIIVRDLNEGVIPQLRQLYNEHKNIRYVHYRSVGEVGRFVKGNPYNLRELQALVKEEFGEEQYKRKITIDGDDMDSRCAGCLGCFQFLPESRLEVCLVDFATKDSETCWKRGKLVEDTFMLETFFENMVQFTEYLNDAHPEYNNAIELGSF